MRKIFCVMILFATMLICGCEQFTVSTIDNEITVTGEDVGDGMGQMEGKVDVIDGGILTGEAKIEKGNVDIIVGDKIYNVDKTQKEVSINLAAGKYHIFFEGHEDFTGELKLHVIPNMPKI